MPIFGLLFLILLYLRNSESSPDTHVHVYIPPEQGGQVEIEKKTIALCNKSNGRCDIKAEKREELESKSSHKSDIWPPAASKKWGEIYWKYIFQTLEAIFPYKGVFFTKVVKANIIAFIKTKILRPVLSVKNHPFTFFEFYTPLNWYL